MVNKLFRILPFFLVFTLVSCAGLPEECLNDEIAPGPGIKILEEWTLSSDDRSDDVAQPRESTFGGGIITIGKSGNKLGAKGSKAVKTFDCGRNTGTKCKIEVGIGDVIESEKEKMTVKIWKGNRSFYDQTFSNRTGTQVKLTVPTCKGIKISISVTEGDNPGIESVVKATVSTQCLNC